SVADAVLARASRLSVASRDAVDQLSVVPSPIAPDLAWELLGEQLHALAEAEAAGGIVDGPNGFGFRHEIARRAIEQSLPAIHRRMLNAAVLRMLRERCDVAQIMHHAAEAGDVEAIVEFGPRAAFEASRAGSHRQALAHFETLLPHAEQLAARARAE